VSIRVIRGQKRRRTLKGKTVLIVDDEEKVLFLLSDALGEKEFKVKTTTSAAEALEILKKEPIDAVLLDLVMPQIDGIKALPAIKKLKPHVPVVMLSGHGTIETAVKTLKLGAHDFLEKTVSTNRILVTLENAIRRSELEQEKRYLLKTVQEEHPMIGDSDAIKKILQLMKKIAPIDFPVLITGENGTGKELVARALHFNSQRAGKPFVPVNASAISEGVMESELFGHEKGAFTGAIKSKPGLFEQAHTGTLFLDEISEMPLKLQPKLLRAIESQEIQRVGGTTRKKVGVRIIAAANQDLAKAVKEGRFRRDLYHRIEVLTIDVPPLRERKEDIPLLVNYFVQKHSRRTKIPVIPFHPHAIELLMKYHWPGNIRELRNVVEKARVLSESNEILPGDIRPHLEPDREVKESLHLPSALTEETLAQAMNRTEKEIISTKLHALDWNYEQVMKELDISRATLFNKIKAHGISSKRKRQSQSPKV
jgi:two-component system nitrogen regulation response regulator NtrX